MEDAAVIVISAEPLKETLLMFLAVWRVVAVPAFPPIFNEDVATCANAVPAASV